MNLDDGDATSLSGVLVRLILGGLSEQCLSPGTAPAVTSFCVESSHTKLRSYVPAEDYRAPFLYSYRSTALLSLGIQTRLPLSDRSSLCLHKRGKAIGESVYVDELLCVLDRPVPARVFIDIVIDD